MRARGPRRLGALLWVVPRSAPTGVAVAAGGHGALLRAARATTAAACGRSIAHSLGGLYRLVVPHRLASVDGGAGPKTLGALA